MYRFHAYFWCLRLDKFQDSLLACKLGISSDHPGPLKETVIFYYLSKIDGEAKFFFILVVIHTSSSVRDLTATRPDPSRTRDPNSFVALCTIRNFALRLPCAWLIAVLKNKFISLFSRQFVRFIFIKDILIIWTNSDLTFYKRGDSI